MASCNQDILKYEQDQRLSPKENYNLLVSLLMSTNGYMKWRLKNLLNSLDTPDLLTLLPPEIQLFILSMVDGTSLLKACQVSKQWNELILSCDLLWKEKSKEIGINLKEKPSCIPWQRAFCMSQRQLHLMEKGEAFREKYINLQNSTKAVKAVDYNNGYMCTVSEDDCINIWQLELNIPVLSFIACHAVSCVTFQSYSTLVCGHFTGILTSWDISEMSDHCFNQYTSTSYNGDGQDFAEFSLLLAKYKMHSGPIFSCDFSEDIGLLVSGGADCMLKFWCLKTGTLLHSLSTEKHWVLRVYLLPFDPSSNCNSILSITQGYSNKYHWPRNCSSDPGLVGPWGDLSQLTLAAFIKQKELSDDFITPDLQISSSYVGLVEQDLQEKQATLELRDLSSFELRFSHPLSFKVRKLMAMGDRFALFLTVGKNLNTSTLVIVDIKTGKNVGMHTIPHLKMTTPDGAQLVVGETKWLDGLAGWEFPGDITENFSLATHAVDDCVDKYGDSSPRNVGMKETECIGSCAKKSKCNEYRKCVEDEDEVAGSIASGWSDECVREVDLQSNNGCNEICKLSETEEREDKMFGEYCEQKCESVNMKCDGKCRENTRSDSNETSYDCNEGKYECKDAFKSKRRISNGKAKHKKPSLVLAAGLRHEGGRVFTLWWGNGKEDKRKMD